MTTPKSLHRLRQLSRPFSILLTIALGLLVLFHACLIGALLFFFQGGDTWHAAVSFAQTGLTLSVASDPGHLSGVALESLALGQRASLALLALVCGACSGLALFHLRQLFALYTRGDVFTGDNIRHIKQFGLWLVVAAVAVNVSGRLFHVITGQHAPETANAALALIYGGMTYVIARVMELGRQADEERKEFV